MNYWYTVVKISLKVWIWIVEKLLKYNWNRTNNPVKNQSKQDNWFKMRIAIKWKKENWKSLGSGLQSMFKSLKIIIISNKLIIALVYVSPV